MDAQAELDRLIAGAGDGFGVEGTLTAGDDGRFLLTATVAEPDDGSASVADALWKTRLIAGPLQHALLAASAAGLGVVRIWMRLPDGGRSEHPIRLGVHRTSPQPEGDGRTAREVAADLALRAERLGLAVEELSVFQVGGMTPRLVARTEDAAGLCRHAVAATSALFPHDELAAGWYLSVGDGGDAPVLLVARATMVGFGAIRVRPGLESDLRVGHGLFRPPPSRR